MKILIAMTAMLVAAVPAAQAQMFKASLAGDRMVPPVKSAASGEVELTVSPDGKSLEYTLDVKDLKDATMAHLHMAPPGQNGEPVVWLYPSPSDREQKTKEGVFTGTLVKGRINPADLLGRLQGKGIADLVAAIKNGNICAIVHTTRNPAGEIRGQVRPI